MMVRQLVTLSTASVRRRLVEQRMNVLSRKVTEMGKLLKRSKALLVFAVVIGVCACGSLLSSAHTPTANITIVNNSSREIRRLYLSAPDQNNWGPDQLGSSVIAAGGGSVTISASCSGASIKVIAEDHEGCFLYEIVSCSGNATWTITNAASPDCDG